MSDSDSDYTDHWTQRKWTVQEGVSVTINDLAPGDELRFDGDGNGSGSNLKNATRESAIWGTNCEHNSPSGESEYVTLKKDGSGDFFIERVTSTSPVTIRCFPLPPGWQPGQPFRLPLFGTPQQACWTAQDGGAGGG
jgi:hypothetical protein